VRRAPEHFCGDGSVGVRIEGGEFFGFVGEFLGVDHVVRHGACFRIVESAELVGDMVEDLAGSSAVSGDDSDGESGVVEEVRIADLRDGDHVLAMEAVLQGRHDTTLVLEGQGVVDDEVKLKESDDHAAGLRSGDQSVRFTSTFL
jgi:hypothetical protein